MKVLTSYNSVVVGQLPAHRLKAADLHTENQVQDLKMRNISTSILKLSTQCILAVNYVFYSN